MDNLIKRLKKRIPEETDDELLLELLDSAKNMILVKRFPFADLPSELESRYIELQLQIAIRMYNKQGAEGEISHIESGVTRNYGTAEEYADLLSKVIPKGGLR